MHVVCKWIGNSQPVAATHYLQLTDEHFLRATSEEAAQKLHETTRNTPNQRPAADGETESNSSKDENLQLMSAYCGSRQVPPAGLEPATRWLRASCSAKLS